MRKFDSSLITFFYAWMGNWVLRLFYSTNRWNVIGANNYQDILKTGKSVLICCWHGQLLPIIKNLSGYNFHAIAGTHKDAEIISRICIKWGLNMIRGSSKEKGAEAYKEIVQVLKSPPALVFITPDGPSGPARIPKPFFLLHIQARYLNNETKQPFFQNEHPISKCPEYRAKGLIFYNNHNKI